MVAKRPRLMPAELRESEAFQRDFKQLLSLTDGQISKLAAIGESKGGFYLRDELIGDVAADLEVEDQDLRSILPVVRYLYSRASTEEIYEEGAEEVCDFAKSIGVKDCDTKVSAIRRLLTKKEAYEHSILVSYSESIAAPTISDVDVACDIRAVVDPRNDEIVDYVPIALMSIELKHSESDKRTVSLQLSQETLDELLEDLNKAKRLLQNLREKFSGKIPTT